MLRLILFLFISIFYSGFINPIVAQYPDLNDEAQISLITVLPGEAPEELFGHSAIRVLDPVSGIDYSFNYGTFQFDEFFLPKFIYGELNYFLSIAYFSNAMDQYRLRSRPVIEQVLNLSAEQKQALFDFLMFNAEEENRYYRYDFLFDNCSTRIRDALKTVLNEDLRYASEPDPRLSFRELIDLYLPHKPFIDFGIDLLLGAPVDRIAQPRETMFLPDYLMEAFNHAVLRANGDWIPLVATTETLLRIEDYEIEKSLPWPSILAWLLFSAGAAVTWFNYKKGITLQRWLDIPLFVFTGIVGLLITFLWFISLHDVTAFNINLLWAWPTHLLVIPLLGRNARPGHRIRLYFLVAFVACLLILVGWLAWPQYLHPAMFPIVLLLALRCSWIGLGSERFVKHIDSGIPHT